MREEQGLQPIRHDNYSRRASPDSANKEISATVSLSGESAQKKRRSYDPTKVKLPPNAIKAAPGDRQIAYPCVAAFL